MSSYNLGDVLKADVFAEGDSVDITGISKGKGYAGTIKRFGAHRSPMSHGAGPMHRHQGSMGSCSDPSRVFKGKIMPGHMGAEQVTVQNLDVVKVDSEMNMIAGSRRRSGARRAESYSSRTPLRTPEERERRIHHAYRIRI